MKFVIFGVTGPTGKLLVEQCLDQGHEITALVRNPDKLPIKHDRLNVKQVDIFQDDLAPHMKACNAVLSCLGAPTTLFRKATIYTESIKVIVAAMRESGVTRFVGITSWGTKDDPRTPWCIRYLYCGLYMRNLLPDMSDMEDYLTNHCQDLDFTVVRPFGLSDKEPSATGIMGYDGPIVPDGVLSIARRDVAEFILMCAVNGEWKKKHVAIARRPQKTI